MGGMRWSDFQDVDEPTVGALASAGVATPAALARVGDVEGLAARAGLDPARLASLREEARSRMHAALDALGIRSANSLATADPALVAEALGGSEEDARAMMSAAARVAKRDREQAAPQEEAQAPPPVEPMPQEEATPPAPTPPPAPVGSPLPDAVLLRESSAKARVRLGGAVTEGVPIVTAREAEDADAALARAEGDAVVLRETSPLASARLNGQVLPPLPIYKERGPGEEGPEETRVRVGRVKSEDGAAAGAGGGPSLLGRLLGRKG